MKFTGKYDTLIEAATTRYCQGGLLSGDLVKIRKDALKNAKIMGMTEQYKAMIQDAMNTDLNLRVGAVKSIRPNTTGNYEGGMWSGTDAPYDYFVDIVIEYAPGLWKEPMTLPIEVLERVDSGINLAPVPDSLKRSSKTELPNEVKTSDENRKTPTTNTKPEFVSKPSDGRDQIKDPVKHDAKNQGKLTLEGIYEKLIKEDGRLINYTLAFSEPYGKNPDELLKRIQTMPGLSNNMSSHWADDNTLKIGIEDDLNPDEIKNMVTNVVKGSVTVTKDPGMTEFGPNIGKPTKFWNKPESAIVGGSAPSLQA